ncbi:hypothetical protein PIB30_011812 [Stylosanthes scabra]|uniref:Uncharacterized protein n=1 Tax=Stylosanthes scabra TaxID=79078 RepID=A0ABU6S5G4_9FABA|nr:hypothetical protein [Stylosanthes scabra]
MRLLPADLERDITGIRRKLLKALCLRTQGLKNYWEIFFSKVILPVRVFGKTLRFIKVNDTTHGFFLSVNPLATFAVKEASSLLFPHLHKEETLIPPPPLPRPVTPTLSEPHKHTVLFSIAASRRQGSVEGPQHSNFVDDSHGLRPESRLVHRRFQRLVEDRTSKAPTTAVRPRARQSPPLKCKTQLFLGVTCGYMIWITTKGGIKHEFFQGVYYLPYPGSCKSFWVVVIKTKPRDRIESDQKEEEESYQIDYPTPSKIVVETGHSISLATPQVPDEVIDVRVTITWLHWTWMMRRNKMRKQKMKKMASLMKMSLAQKMKTTLKRT